MLENPLESPKIPMYMDLQGCQLPHPYPLEMEIPYTLYVQRPPTLQPKTLTWSEVINVNATLHPSSQ